MVHLCVAKRKEEEQAMEKRKKQEEEEDLLEEPEGGERGRRGGGQGGRREVCSIGDMLSWATGRSHVEYGATFQRLDGHSVPSQIQITTPSSLSTAAGNAPDNSACETYHVVPLPQPYDADPRYSRLQREGLVSRREKSMNHTQEELHTLRRNGSSSAVETLGAIKKRNIAESEEGFKLTHPESEKYLSAKACDTSFVITTPEDEDVCPTCLEVNASPRRIGYGIVAALISVSGILSFLKVGTQHFSTSSSRFPSSLVLMNAVVYGSRIKNWELLQNIFRKLAEQNKQRLTHPETEKS
ncbi:Zinc finger, C3HC4 type (RING finger) [Musa troglodytarum]|uniref:Zinc finger, C3HC4 type (RING finger) n=1 Tax=Musa troglodytarum TaxID=320322 RepID=A0A9E7JV77_9LILI|nr:Zinc finger, C3HC4 type (RING finger) [Musa troglodytarum]